MIKSDSIVELSKALAKFQANVKQPMKDKDNPFFRSKYVPLENVVEAITQEAPKHGLSFVQWALNDESGRVGVATMLMHESGEFIEFDAVHMKADKETAQGAGALISYLKRYSLSAVFGITSDQDDDGNSASGNVNKNAPRQTPPKQIAATQAEIGNLKKEVHAFSNLMKEQGKDVKPEQVEQTLNITDYAKLNSEDVKEAVNKLKGWSK